jgi:hypothetical protein
MTGRPGDDPGRSLRRRRDRDRGPRRAGEAIASLAAALAPQTLLADVQRVWVQAVGAGVAEQAEPTAAHAGVVTVSCRSSVWAAELDLLSPTLVDQLNEVLGEPLVTALRCQVAPAARWARDGLPGG